MAGNNEQKNITDQDPKKDSSVKVTQHKRSHIIRPGWIRIPLKILFWLMVVVLLLPVLLYIPPIQTAVKDLACRIVHDSTGMTIGVEKFRLKFPLDISLQGVTVIEASGDTMVNAREALVDVKLLPLLKLDLQVNKLSLNEGYYRFVSPDSSMIMKIRAAKLDVDSKSSVNIEKSEINLNEANLQGGVVSLYMNVWKQQPTPQDTTSTPFLIRAGRINISDMRFAMSMLPTIDTLTVKGEKMLLENGIIDLRTNNITASLLDLDGGNFKYIAPTPEYVATHPVPVDSAALSTPPMTIRGDSIRISNVSGIYAIKGAKPIHGFDPNYIQVKNVNIGVRGFYNCGTTLSLPIMSMTAEERSGLRVTEGSGTVSINDDGIVLTDMNVQTPYSRLNATADIPYALMELQPQAPVRVLAEASLGLPDIESFMPDLQTYLKHLPGRTPLTAKIEASGRLDNVDIGTLDAAMAGIFSLRAKGYARNALDLKKLVAVIDIDGEVESPATVEKLAGPLGFDLPKFKIKGRATADRENYGAKLALTTPKGNVVADAEAGLNSQKYEADITVDHLNVASFMPDLGIGYVTGYLKAAGTGFNPLTGKSHSDVNVCLDRIDYNGRILRDISMQARLTGNSYHIELDSPNTILDLETILDGSIEPDDYTVNGYVNLHNVDLCALGFSETVLEVSASLDIDGRLQPEKWIYDASLNLDRLKYTDATSEIELPTGLSADIHAGEKSVSVDVAGDRTTLAFRSAEGLQKVIEGFTAMSEQAMKQIEARSLDMAEMQKLLPPFTLSAKASGNGILGNVLQPSGIGIDSLSLRFCNDSLIHGGITINKVVDKTLTLDTVSFAFQQRGSLIDYRVHLGNRPGTMDEFAQVNLSGYMGTNRLSAYLLQKNIMGETGYRLGFTAAFEDSTVNVHFTPLKATIAYMPWSFNEDNEVTCNLVNYQTTANLKASSAESSILLMTEQNEKGEEQLHLNLTNIQVEDFLKMSVAAPPIQASVNSDITVRYTGKALIGKGSLDINRLIYDKQYIGDLGFDLKAGTNLTGKTGASIGLKINNQNAMMLQALLSSTPDGMEPEHVKLKLTGFPLSVANAFLDADLMKLSGRLTGEMDMSGSLSSPVLNGGLHCDSVAVFVPMIGSSLKFDDHPITVTDNILTFHDFGIYGANKNPLTIAGSVNAQKLSDISFDLKANAANFQLINNDRRAKSDIYGKLFMNIGATVTGPMKHFDINANVGILGTTDVFYNLDMAPEEITAVSTDDVVKFVNLNDTVQIEKADSVATSLAMRIRAGLTITPGAQVTVNLANNGTYKCALSPSGTVNYFQNFMGDMTLNGQLYLGNGMVRYGLPVIGDKTFQFNPNSSVTFNGNIMNPTLNISATDEIKASVTSSGGTAQRVNFLVTVDVTGTLDAPKVVFDLSTNDDLSLQNELSSMSPDQRSTQAMNLLITGMYTGNDMKTQTGSLVTGGLYSFLTSQINSWAAKNIRGVDLSFGIDQYDSNRNGQNATATSYSYQVSKSLFSNRFKIIVGGNYSTDVTSDESIADNLFSDISFEYTLKQTNNLTMLLKLYRHIGFESILEGQVTDTGLGFVMRRRLSNLKRLFKIRWGKGKKDASSDEKSTTLPDEKNEATTPIEENKDENPSSI